MGKEERRKCVRNPSKLRQKCVKNPRNTFGGEHLLDDASTQNRHLKHAVKCQKNHGHLKATEDYPNLPFLAFWISFLSFQGIPWRALPFFQSVCAPLCCKSMCCASRFCTGRGGAAGSRSKQSPKARKAKC